MTNTDGITLQYDPIYPKIEPVVRDLYNLTDENQIANEVDIFKREVSQQVYEGLTVEEIAKYYRKNNKVDEGELKDCINIIMSDCIAKLEDEANSKFLGSVIIIGSILLGIFIYLEFTASSVVRFLKIVIWTLLPYGGYLVNKGINAKELLKRIDRVNNPEKYKEKTEQVIVLPEEEGSVVESPDEAGIVLKLPAKEDSETEFGKQYNGATIQAIPKSTTPKKNKYEIYIVWAIISIVILLICFFTLQ